MIHHSVNISAVVVPIIAWVASMLGLLQPIAAFVLTILGIAYYVRMFWRERE